MHEVHLLVFRLEHEVTETRSISVFVFQDTGAKYSLLFAKERITIHQTALQNIECTSVWYTLNATILQIFRVSC